MSIPQGPVLPAPQIRYEREWMAQTLRMIEQCLRRAHALEQSLPSTYQPLDGTLTAFAALTIAANSLTIGTGADAFSQTTFAANRFPARASTGNLEAKTITDFGLSLVDDANAAAAQSTLGLLGVHAVWIAAGSMSPSASGGCAALATIASAANQPDIQTLDFDASTQEYAQFSLRMPESWDEGTITFKPVWSHAATVTNFGVVWDCQAVAISDDDAIAVNFGTPQTSTDTGGTTNDVYIGPTSSAITVGGTPQPGDLVCFRVSRVTGNGSDTMAVDARLHGVVIFLSTNTPLDA